MAERASISLRGCVETDAFLRSGCVSAKMLFFPGETKGCRTSAKDTKACRTMINVEMLWTKMCHRQVEYGALISRDRRLVDLTRLVRIKLILKENTQQAN